MTGVRKIAAHQRLSGFTLLELLIVCALVGVLASVALGRLWAIQQVAEEAMAEQVLGALKNGIRIRSAELITSARWDEFRDLPKTNPFDWLEELPGNYRGELKGAGEAGYWYFDKAGGVVSYYVKRSDDFQSANGALVMRFVVLGLDGAGQSRKTPPFAWVGLRPESEYIWLGRVLR
jgi:prepilin-type N-terminal cleavage/methylation domain-containing protein